MRKSLTILNILALMTLWAVTVSAEETVSSPDGKIVFTLDCADGKPVYSVTYSGTQVVASSALGLKTDADLGAWTVTKCEKASADTSWKPLWGEYAEIPDRHNDLNVTLKNADSVTLGLEIRVYDEGFAFRYGRDAEKVLEITGEQTEFRIPADVLVFPINSTEATFPEDGIALADLNFTAYPPLTGKFADGRVFSLMEAYAVDYPRLTWRKAENGAIVPNVRKTTWEKAPEGVPLAWTPWRAMMLAENEARLVEREYFIFNLNPPADYSKFDWVKPGKTISNEMNCQITRKELFSMVDFAAENGIKYVQIDWGWYGTEYVYSDAECDEWARNNPQYADDPTWRANTRPDPRKVAQGRVPYFPRFKASTYVDINIKELVEYGKSKGVGICLYLNDRMIKAYDIAELFPIYESWGLAGLKPGFVAYGSAKDTNDLRRLAEVAAKHHLWLCIHDAYLPDGSMREFPNVMNVEGGGGQEGNHPAFQDVVLPFTRYLVGPFDFTPAMFFHDRSNCHQLSLLVTFYAPSHVIRSGWAIRNNTHGNAFGSEKEWFAAVGSEWVDTKVLDAEIGRRIVTVRKTKEGEWFLGATNGSHAVTSKVSLSFLDSGREYELSLWTDAPEADGAYRAAVKTVKKVRSTDTLELPMAENGGAVAVFR